MLNRFFADYQMGWHDRAMVDRYAADMQDQRAFEAKRRRGDLY